MHPFGDLARRVMRFAGASLAREERAGLGPQPVEIIPGMPNAPEACLLIDKHWTPEAHPRNAIGQPKIDGIRSLALQSRIVSREAMPLDVALHCLPALDRLERKLGEPMVFDGEYQEPDGFQATLSAMRRGEGVGTFYLFDAVPYSQWRANRFDQPLEARLDRLQRAVAHDEPFLAFLPPVDVPTASHAIQLAGKAWAQGCEGIVVKDARSLYHRGRSTSWWKLKRSATLDGLVVDVASKDGSLERAVALVRLSGRVHRIAAMPPDIRAMIRNDLVHGGAAGLTGQMVEVSFNEVTDGGALRGAQIVRLRPDKPKGE